jgi:hypothetical protein
MGFIIWYKLTIEEGSEGGPGALLGAAAALVGGGLPVTASNDVFSGQYVLDANLTLKMAEGASADTFAATLFNLPADVVNTLKAKHAEAMGGGKPLQAQIFLGYFEDMPQFAPADRMKVMSGAITRLRSSVNDEGLLVTEMSGEEIGGYRLRTLSDFAFDKREEVTADQLVKEIAKSADVTVHADSSVKLKLSDFTLRAKNGLAALQEIARRAEAPLVIRDKTIYLGAAVGRENGLIFSADTNIVKMDEAAAAEEIPERLFPGDAGKTKTAARSSLEMTVLGDPRLRVGQTVEVDTSDAPKGPLRIGALEHTFSTQGGYTCKVTLLSAEPGQDVRLPSRGVAEVVDRFQDMTEAQHGQRPPVDVGEVTSYEPGGQKHLATLNYGQSPSNDKVAPSVATPVDKRIQLHRKPMVSPFAWHKCGLVVPVYPKMRALLAHNRGLVNDAVVAGFLWPEDPLAERPDNQAGDYWLCLPTKLGGDDLPTGPGVNDLIDKDGLRVIQARGLHILVAAKAPPLPNVGVRPTPPAEKTIVIEHQEKTKITVASDGALTIETDQKDITFTNGKVKLTLSGSAVEVKT